MITSDTCSGRTPARSSTLRITQPRPGPTLGARETAAEFADRGAGCSDDDDLSRLPLVSGLILWSGDRSSGFAA